MKQLYFFIFSFCFFNISAQTDTEFWFAAPEVSANNANFDKPIVLRITAYNQASTVTISQPANGSFTTIVVNIAANATSTTDLTPWIAQIENLPPDNVLNYGLLITASTPVTAYYEVVSQQCLCNPEIFALKGRNGLGLNFFIPSQNFVNNNTGYNPVPYSSFDIVATDNNTTVTITPINNVVGHAAGVPYNITLNRGQTYSATATSQSAAQHLTGSTVIADKPIAITIKDDLMSGAPFGGCADLGGDQLVPVEFFGTKYAVVRGFLNSPFDKVFVLAIQNGTTVSVDGVLTTTINTGQTYMIDMPNAARFIETSAPVSVLQLSGFGCELGMSILPPIECTGSTSVAITRSTSESLFLNLIVRTGGQNNFLFNGAAGIINVASFAPVPGSGGMYQYAQVTITTGQLAAGAAAIVSNTSDFFHLGIIHGSGGGGTRFGYFSNFNRIEVAADGFSVPVCEGFPIQLNANSPFSSATFAWTGPNTFSSAQKNPVIPNAQAINAGDYIVVATVSGCPSTPDTVPVAVINCGQQISGIINTYTPVTAIDVCKNAVTVGSANGFTVGSRVLLIQMKGVQINTTNSTAFGDITSYDDAGNYEFANIQSITGNQITFVNTIQRTYNITGFVQLVTVPQYSGNVHAVNAPVTCQPWNGSTGGIVVFEAAGTVTLNADIDASDKGFRAGIVSLNLNYTCDQLDYFYPITSEHGGRKGEGVFELTNAIINGRGKNANGGGGGNNTNSGGAGGANAGGGGRGGDQWTGCPALPIGGDGGLALQYSNVQNKIFLAGGAGGGHQNNATASAGSNGAGIVLIKSNGITANGGAIKSFALNVPVTAGDGSGGGGGGGTVLLDVNTFTGNLTVDVHGGNGGDNNGHGVGGGGGGGIVWSKNALPGNVTTNVNGGNTGIDASVNTPRGGTNGAAGIILSGVVLPESTVPFTPLTKPVASSQNNVCEGETINLNASTVPNVTYSWTGPNGFISAQQNPSILNAAIVATGDYIVAVEDVLGCIERDTVTINVRPKYSFTVNANICSGDVYTRPSGATTSTAGTYNDTLQTAFGCDSVIVTILAVTTIPLQTNNDTSICRGNPVQLNATGGNYYRWRPATALSDTAIANPVATPTQSTQYIVTAFAPSQNLIVNGDFESGNTGFTSSYQYKTPPNTTEGQYFVGPNAQAWNGGMAACSDHTSGTGNMMLVNGAVTPNQTIWCQTVSVQPNTDYAFSTWVQMVEASNPAILQFSINSNLLGAPFTAPAANCQWAEFYQLWNSGNNTTANICIVNQNTGAGGNDFGMDDISFSGLCEASDTVLITINRPDTTVVNPEICFGNSYTLPDGSSVNTAGVYVDTLLTTQGCDSIIITNLFINPVFSDTVITSICNGETYNLPDGNTATTTGVHIANLQTVKGCDSIITTLLDVLPNSFTTIDTFICPNTAFTRPSGIVVNTPGTYSDTLTAANFCDSVVTTNLQLHPVYAQTITDTICNGATYTLPDGNTAIQSGTYNIALTTINGCDSLFTVNLTVLNVTATTTVINAKCFGSSDGSITVNATGGVNPYTFVMNTSITQSGINTTTFSNLAAGNYSFDITDAKGCTATTTAVVNEPTQVALTGIATDVTCFGFADGSAQLSATGGTPPYQFTLNNASNSNGLFTGLTAGNYTATVSDANNCAASFAFTVTEPNAAEITITPETLVLKLGGKDSMRLSSNYDPDVVYNWSPQQGLSCYDCPATLATSFNTITYTITANATINGNVCIAETQVQVIVEPDYTLFVPNLFSPNNDGANDYFAWYGNKDGIKQMELQLFNRWGEKVFESEDKNFIWDGFYNGRSAPDGMYVYTIKVTWLNGFSNNKYKGSLMLVR